MRSEVLSSRGVCTRGRTGVPSRDWLGVEPGPPPGFGRSRGRCSACDHVGVVTLLRGSRSAASREQVPIPRGRRSDELSGTSRGRVLLPRGRRSDELLRCSISLVASCF